MDNVLLFIILGSVGFLVTIFLWITGEKTQQNKRSAISDIPVTILTFSVSLVLLMYIFRLVMMFFTGLLSGIPNVATIGVLFGVAPVIILGLLRYRSRNRVKEV